MRQFDYIAPDTVQDALAALGSHTDAAVLAGGTDLILRMKQRQRSPGAVVDIKRIEGLDGLEAGEKSLSLGALVTMSQVERAEAVQRGYRGLHSGAAVVGSTQIRNRATVVGNVCNATPCADTVPPLIALGAAARIAGSEGDRWLPVERLYVGPGETLIEPGELVLAVEVPAPEPRSGSAYARHTTRSAMDLATVGVAVALTLEDDDETCHHVRIALGAVAPTPLRATQAEEVLRGQALEPGMVAAAAGSAADEARPITDVRASAPFRRELVRVLVGRMVQAAAADARQRQVTPGRS